MIVLRINKDDELVESAPCYHCLQTAKENGIKKISYSNSCGEVITKTVSQMCLESDKSSFSSGNRWLRDLLEIIDSF